MRIAALCLLLFAVPVFADGPDPTEIELLVEDLGAASPSRRRAAERSLALMREQALPALRAADAHESALVRAAVRRLLQALDVLGPTDERRLKAARTALLDGPAGGRDAAARTLLGLGRHGARALRSVLSVRPGDLSVETLPRPAVVRVGQPWSTRVRLRHKGAPALLRVEAFAIGSGFHRLVSSYDMRLRLARRGSGSRAIRVVPLASLRRMSADAPFEKAVRNGGCPRPGRYPRTISVDVGGPVRSERVVTSGVGEAVRGRVRRRSFYVRYQMLVLPDWRKRVGLPGGLALTVEPLDKVVDGGTTLRARIRLRNGGSRPVKLPADWSASMWVALAVEGDAGWVRWGVASERQVTPAEPLEDPPAAGSDVEEEEEEEEVEVVPGGLPELIDFAAGAELSIVVRLPVPAVVRDGRASLIAGMHLFAHESGSGADGMGHDGVPRGHAVDATTIGVRARRVVRVTVAD